MRVTDPIRSLLRARPGCGRFLARTARIGIALSLVLALFGVHFELAHADVPGAPGITCCVIAVDHAVGVAALEQAAHLAGHLTGVLDPSASDIVAIDMTRRRQPIRADSLPRSTTLPAPSEPPRA